MSKRIRLMKRKIEQAVKAGRDPMCVMPNNLKRKSLLKLFEKPKP